jgi:ribosomal protein L11 methyltransferase
MAHLWEAPVLACDSDRNAVAVARDNTSINGVAARVRVIKSEGFGAAVFRRDGPFDLIVANILAGPLRRLARGFARHLAPGGAAILSGLMTEQEPQVIAAQTRHGLVLRRCDRLDDWSVLEFQQRRSAAGRR